MSDPLRFPERRPPLDAARALGQELADDFQKLVLLHPIAAREVLKLVKRLLLTDAEEG